MKLGAIQIHILRTVEQGFQLAGAGAVVMHTLFVQHVRQGGVSRAGLVRTQKTVLCVEQRFAQ